MNIQEKLFELRDDELVSISAKEKKELLGLCPNYYKTSELEKLITELLIDGTNGRIEIIQSDILDFAIHKKEVLLL